MSDRLVCKKTFIIQTLIVSSFTQEELQYIYDSGDTITKDLKDYRRISITATLLKSRTDEATNFKVTIFCHIFNGIISTTYFLPHMFEVRENPVSIPVTMVTAESSLAVLLQE